MKTSKFLREHFLCETVIVRLNRYEVNPVIKIFSKNTFCEKDQSVGIR